MQLLHPEARQLTGDELFDLYDTPGPYVRAGVLVSLDGATSYDGRSGPLQTAGDLQVFRVLRAVADAVVVGAGTVRAEDYGPVRLTPAALAWRSARGRAGQVPLVVVSRSLELPADARWLRSGRPVVLTCESAPAQRRNELARHADVVVVGGDEVDLRAGCDALADRGLAALLCEGGPTLFGHLARAGLLTEVCATVAPVFAGAGDGVLNGPLAAPLPLELTHLLREQSTLLGRWTVSR